MQNAQSIRNQRRATAKTLHLLAIGGIVVTLCTSAGVLMLSKKNPGNHAEYNAGTNPVRQSKG